MIWLFLISLLPAAALLRLELMALGAGKRHVRVRSAVATHRVCNLTLLVEFAMAVRVLAQRWLLQALAVRCRAASRGFVVRCGSSVLDLIVLRLPSFAAV